MSDNHESKSNTSMADTIASISDEELHDESESDSDNWDPSDDEAWPVNSARYAPVGDDASPVSAKGSNRLASEFTMGTGFHHLTQNGNKVMFRSNDGVGFPSQSGSPSMTYHNNAAMELMKKHNIDEEELYVSKSTYLDKVLLVTDAPHKLRIYVGDDDGLCIVGMALIRDGVEFTSGTLAEEIPPLTLELDSKSPVIESIELQECTWLEGRNRLEKKISYLRMVAKGSEDVLCFGEPRPSGFDKNKSIYGQVESAHGNLCVSGIGYFDNKPISLQVVDLGSDCDNLVDSMETCVYYGHGVISGSVIRSRCAEVEFLTSITTEKNEVWDVLLGCMDAVENSSPSYGELLPNAVNLLEGALNGDIHTIHSILRMDRFLTYTIMERKTIQTFKNDNLNFYAKLIPMKQMWGVFSNAIERIKRIHSYQPELNSFNVTFLDGSDNHWNQAIFIFLTQLSLLLLTMSHIWINRADVLHIPTPLQFIVSICGTIVVHYMANQSKNNFNGFAIIFPDYIGTTLYKLDAFSNIVGGWLVTLCTFLLLFMTDDNLDIVLDATALLFVLELDEMMVEKNPIWITGVYRAYFMRDIMKNLDDSDHRYWDPSYLRKDRGEHYRLHPESCSILFPRK